MWKHLDLENASGSNARDLRPGVMFWNGILPERFQRTNNNMAILSVSKTHER